MWGNCGRTYGAGAAFEDRPGGGGKSGGDSARRGAGSCPLWALGEWRAAAKIEIGALFRPMNRHGQVLNHRLPGEAVGMVVKRYVVGWVTMWRTLPGTACVRVWSPRPRRRGNRNAPS